MVKRLKESVNKVSEEGKNVHILFSYFGHGEVETSKTDKTTVIGVNEGYYDMLGYNL